MQDLTLVGLTEDKTKLVLVSDAGEEYTLPADAKLRAALRGDHARLGQLEIEMDSALRPRDIQARIRAGESPESVAQAAQTTVDRIMGYATPVLAERAHIADRAQRASVRRKTGEGPARLLGDAVAERLRSRNIAPESVDWDAWRREDGRWTLVARYKASDRERRAEFVFDAPGRYVVPEDDEARGLVGEQTSKPAARSGGQRASSPRRLSAVSTEDELPLGTDAIEMVADDSGRGTGAGADDERTVDLSPAARAVRERPATGDRASDPAVPTGDADWMATQASDRPAVRPAATPAAGATDTATEPASAPSVPVEQHQVAEEREDATPKKGGRKGRRASVPSWDEIMFGGGRSE